jgi:hypothetical protein
MQSCGSVGSLEKNKTTKMFKDNLIKIKGGSYDDIKKALKQWIMLYSNELGNNIKFELYKIEQESYMIVADKRLNNEKFNYLINYLRHPEEIEYKIDIEGYTTAREEKTYSKRLLNKKIIVYVPNNDKEYDNVFVTTEDSETYKIDFSGKVTLQNESKTFFTPDFDTTLLQRPERISLNKQEIAEIEKEKSKNRLKKKFRFILSLIVTLIFINYLSLVIIPQKEIGSITTFTLIFSVGVWFHSDYKMLRIDKYFLYCFIIAIADLLYGIMINKYVTLIDFSFYYFCFPIIFLIIQKPLRLYFIRKLDREPIVEKESSGWDVVYNISLIILPVGIILAIANFM